MGCLAQFIKMVRHESQFIVLFSQEECGFEKQIEDCLAGYYTFAGLEIKNPERPLSASLFSLIQLKH